MTPAAGGALIFQETFRIAAKSLMGLKVATVDISYYRGTSIPLTADNIEWDPHLKNFSVQ